MNLNEAIRKASKLLKLAQSPNAEEAASAAAKAQEIIDKYRLDIDDIDFDANTKAEDNEEVKDFGYEDPLDTPGVKDFSVEMLQLAKTVSYHNQTKVFFIKGASTYELQFKIIGRPTDVQTTRYLYGFFKQQILEMVKRICKGNSHTYKWQFLKGVVATIGNKLEDQHEKTVNEAKTSHAGNPLALAKVDKAVARLDKRREDIDDFLNAYRFKWVAEEIEVPFEVARLFCKYRRDEARSLFETEELFIAACKRYDNYIEDQMKAARKLKGGYGRSAFSGSRTETGGYEHGKREGVNIRMTKASGAIGSSRKEIN